MPSKEFKRVGEQQYTMPPDLLNLSPEELDQRLFELSHQALNHGQKQIAELNSIENSLPETSLHKPKVAELKEQATEAITELTLDLSQNGVELPAAQEKGWTPERVEEIRARLEAKKNAKIKDKAELSAAERRRFLGDLTVSLMPLDKKLAKLAREIDPTKITGAQEKEVEATETILESYFKQGRITEAERYQILSQLPNFVEAKKAMISFQIAREEENIKMNERMKKNPSTVTLRGTGGAVHMLQDKRIAASHERITNLKQTLKQLKKAA